MRLSFVFELKILAVRRLGIQALARSIKTKTPRKGIKTAVGREPAETRKRAQDNNVVSLLHIETENIVNQEKKEKHFLSYR